MLKKYFLFSIIILFTISGIALLISTLTIEVDTSTSVIIVDISTSISNVEKQNFKDRIPEHAQIHITKIMKLTKEKIDTIDQKQKDLIHEKIIDVEKDMIIAEVEYRKQLKINNDFKTLELKIKNLENLPPMNFINHGKGNLKIFINNEYMNENIDTANSLINASSLDVRITYMTVEYIDYNDPFWKISR